PITELEECYSMVRRESMWLATMKGEPEKPEASALQDRTGSNYFKSTTNANKSTYRCTHCDQSGHTKSRCFELVGYPDWWDHNRDPRKKNSHKNSTSAVVESKDIQTRQTIGCGVKRRNLYYLDMESKREYQEEVLNLDLQISKEVELSTREEVAELNAQDMDELNLGNGEHLEKEVSSLSLASESLEPQEANTPNNHLLAEDAHDMAKPSRKQLPPRHNRGIPKPTYELEISSK
ncbi:hypothetical protein S83_017322, partial [Arachis hypogaea]